MTMDTKKMRACAPLLPPPGAEVVVQCLDEIDRLRAGLEDVANPIAAMQRKMPDGYRLDGVAAIHALKDPQTFIQMARDVLDA